MPKRVILSADSIHLLADGFAGKVIDRELANLFRDIEERSHDGKPRELNIKITMVPDGKNQVDIDCKVTTKIPAVVPPSTTSRRDQLAGGLVFNPECGDNPDQGTLFSDDDDKAGATG